MGVAESCPRCGAPVRPPDLMDSHWRCDEHGPVAPLHVAERISAEILQSAVTRIGRVPLWCPWPMPQGWLVTGVGWAGDPREAARATVLACSGPSLLDEGPADLVFVAEEPGLGLGNRYAGLAGADPGPYLADALTNTAAHAKLKAAGHPTPLWTVQTKPDRSVYIGEAKGFWLYAIAWPQVAGYLLSEVSALDDLSEWLPSELTFGAPSPYLHGRA